MPAPRRPPSRSPECTGRRNCRTVREYPACADSRSIHLADRLDKCPQLRVILATRVGRDAAADVDRPGMELAHRAIDVVRRQTPRNNYWVFARHCLRLRPRPCSPGTADGARHPGIQQRMVPVFKADGGQVFALLHPEGRQQEQAERAILLRQRPVDLERGQATGLRNLADLLRGLIDEDADALDAGRHLGDHRFDLVDTNLALAAGEDESEQVGSQLDGQFHVLGPGIAADLDLRHAPLSSRTFASRSTARSSDSPTSTASTPRRRSSSTSARLSMPLSLITTRPAGIRGRKRTVVSRSVFILARSRLLMPMMTASARSARSNSSSE